jgi:hypothetical protein
LLVYTDDGIFIGPDQKSIQECYDVLAEAYTDAKGQQYRAFQMTDEGDLSDYLGVKITPLENGTFRLAQPHLINSILKDLGLGGASEKSAPTKTKPTPAPSQVKLSQDIEGAPYEEQWSYRSVIGKMNFLEKLTRVDISYAVHQCARFASDPKQSHAQAVKYIGRYLLGTREEGIILNPKDQSLDVWVDADFCGNWDPKYADVDPSTAKSRTGYIIMYGGSPVVWASKMQREVALSSTEAEYNAISESLRPAINLMELMGEAKRIGWTIATKQPQVHCKVFEDNSGALEMARLPKMRPRTKHFCTRMHHFREYVRKGQITISKVQSREQLGDIATKPQPRSLFEEQQEKIMCWQAATSSREALSLHLPGSHLMACEILGEAHQASKPAAPSSSK